ncbi:methylmalonyl-CoA mutase family protein [Flavitalea sp. BT771]|uniref:methylmalonyl-CoA mutase family protein n=1 Tax=Flavitalea sp. BT771 TaxID=3063329 RepID=UPI0026E2A7A4|nr:methylmalonyl-CoA mutase family protein [Flavitalea sp. BT771]MDO6434216.1 methylmalonyl-CoA mutase family protein [Flavitalea sp. BT771]MDV6223116.1 methylmalonyl-CoA mutase family protein [Flavitalea sp. BT771]
MNYTPLHKVRIVTAAALFDGHDAAINIMRRLLQSKGAEIIHLGHNRSVAEIVECAIEEDVQGIAITSYQGGHLEFFKYMKDLLDQNGCGHIRLFGGGGGTILPQEIHELQQYGITRIYSPDDGRRMGLEGMIEDVIKQCDFPLNGNPANFKGEMKLGEWKDIRKIARAISNAENGTQGNPTAVPADAPLVVGITGTGGAGKSSVTDELVRRYLHTFTDKTIAVISVDPSKKKTGGALLGDRIRMNAVAGPRCYMRSLATRDSDKALSAHVQEAIDICKQAGYDLILLESAGVGQSDASILDHVNLSIYVMTPEYGAASQLEKINMLDYADLVVLNKFDKAGAKDALHDIRKQYKRNHGLWNARDGELPVIGTIASQFNDAGVNELFEKLMGLVNQKASGKFTAVELHPHLKDTATQSTIIPPSRVRYLSEISAQVREYNKLTDEQAAVASKLYKLDGVIKDLPAGSPAAQTLQDQQAKLEKQLFPVCKKLIDEWEDTKARYQKEFFEYDVRGKIIRQPLYTESLSHLPIPKIAVPRYHDWGDILRWRLQENFPGKYPFTAGSFPLKRVEEDPTRMFAGEGGPERTNKRFHYVSVDQPAKRLSTAFDSVTLYGEDPDPRPDIYGKVGNAGVSIATVDDAKKLYSGFDLCDPRTSVSMTINGPAPILLAFFMNAAIDQRCEKYLDSISGWESAEAIIRKKYEKTGKPIYYNPSHPGRLPEGNNGLGLRLLGMSADEVLPPEVYSKIKAEALAQVRGTVQADILKEDQAQNTCIFSTEFALRLMGDVQAYFIEKDVRNFYSVSISGYHIAEAGANPITQLAFTLANGFTYVEYYLSRGMDIDDFAPNLSFFFSNGMDPEYSVIGRVARRIWAKAIKHLYKGNSRSQKLKYHIQTSGRSLHAQEIDFNDIRTTLQALYAIYDNCNSLHTNAYDEAITTPTEESVRRAMAIQLIINRELGSARTENFTQGSFAMEALTDLVEAAVMTEFDKLTDRGGVLGAMERMYQRNKIQEESLYYESLKHSGELPIIGVNTFLNKKGSPTMLPGEVIRSTTEEKDQQIHNLRSFRKRNEENSGMMLKRLKEAAVNNGNLFTELMETVKYCSLGQITHALYEVGGQYRRNM